jgi:hypothetical protein
MLIGQVYRLFAKLYNTHSRDHILLWSLLISGLIEGPSGVTAAQTLDLGPWHLFSVGSCEEIIVDCRSLRVHYGP